MFTKRLLASILSLIILASYASPTVIAYGEELSDEQTEQTETVEETTEPQPELEEETPVEEEPPQEEAPAEEKPQEEENSQEEETPIEEEPTVVEESEEDKSTEEPPDVESKEDLVRIDLEQESSTAEQETYLNHVQNAMQGLEPYDEEYAQTLTVDKLLPYALACCKGSLLVNTVKEDIELDSEKTLIENTKVLMSTPTVTLGQLPVGTKIVDYNTCWEGEPLVWVKSSIDSNSLFKSSKAECEDAKQLYYRSGYPTNGFCRDYRDKNYTILISDRDLLLYDSKLETGSVEDRKLIKWLNEPNMNLIKNMCFFDTISKSLKDFMKPLPAISYKHYNDDAHYYSYGGINLYVLPSILCEGNQLSRDDYYGYHTGFNYFKPSFSFDTYYMTSAINDESQESLSRTTDGFKLRNNTGKGAVRPAINVSKNLLLLGAPDENGIYRVLNEDFCDTPELHSTKNQQGQTLVHSYSEDAEYLELYKDGDLVSTTQGNSIAETVLTDGEYYVVAKNGEYQTESNHVSLTGIISCKPIITTVYSDSEANYSESQLVSFNVHEDTQVDSAKVESVGVTNSKGESISLNQSGELYSFNSDVNDIYTITAEDNFGQTATQSLTVSKVDKDNPVIEYELIDTGFKNDFIQVRLKATDATSGIKSILLPDGTEVTSSMSTFKATENKTYSATTYDNSGKSASVEFTIDKIDIMNPTAEITASTTEATANPVTLTITANDKNGIAKIVLPDGSEVNNSTATFTVSENGEYEFIIYDVANNNITKSYIVDNIDKQGPVNSITPSESNQTNQPVTLTIKASDISGVKSITLPDGTVVENKTATFIANSNGTYKFESTDNLNLKTETTYEVDNIDTLKPQLEILPETEELVKGKLNVTISANDNESVSKIILSNGEEIKSDHVVTTLSENGIVSASVVDTAGNITQDSQEFNNIDNIKPTVVVTYSDNIVPDKVVLHIKATDNNSINSIILPDGTSIKNQSEADYTVTDNGEYTIKVIDSVGLTSEKTVSINCIDKELPKITDIIISPTNSISKLFTGKDIKVEAKALDNNDISAIYYKVEGADWEFKQYTKPLVFESNINSRIIFKAEDVAGNESKLYKSDKIEVDTELPTITASVSTLEPTNEPIKITFTTADNKGISYIKSPSGEMIKSNTLEYIAKENGNYTVYTYDLVGNESEACTVTIPNIDTVKPEMEFTYDNTLTNGDVQITCTAMDASGIKSIELPDLGIKVNESTCKFTVSENGIYTAIVTDSVGNEATKTVEINCIDKEMPVIESIDLGEANWFTKLITNKEVTLIVTATDKTGIFKYEYQLINTDGTVFKDWSELNGSTGVIANKDFDGSVNVRVIDKVDNISEIMSKQFRLDITEPKMTYTLNTNMPTDKPVLVTLNASDNNSVLYITLPNGNKIYSNTATYLIRDNGSYIASVTDTAGLVTKISIPISNIKGFGVPDDIPFIDLDGDKKNDYLLKPPNQDGDDFVDINGDGEDDRKDTDSDGIIDFIDIDGDDKNDMKVDFLDLDDDGKNDLDPSEDDSVDINGDGKDDRIIDTETGKVIGIDIDGNGKNDFVDTNGNGAPDWIDVDGDGKNDIDKIFIDADGDGKNDATRVLTSAVTVLNESNGAEVTVKSEDPVKILVPTRILDEKDISEPEEEYQAFYIHKSTKVLGAFHICYKSDIEIVDSEEAEKIPDSDKVSFFIIKEGVHDIIISDEVGNDKEVQIPVTFEKGSSSTGGSNSTSIQTKIEYIEKPVIQEKIVEIPYYIEKSVTLPEDTQITDSQETKNSSNIRKEENDTTIGTMNQKATNNDYISLTKINGISIGGLFIVILIGSFFLGKRCGKN